MPPPKKKSGQNKERTPGQQKSMASQPASSLAQETNTTTPTTADKQLSHKRVVTKVVTTTNPNPPKKKFRHASWNRSLFYKDLHVYDVSIPNLNEDMIFICHIKRHCDGRAIYAKPIMDLYYKEPEKCLDMFQALSFEEIRDPSAEHSLNKPLRTALKGEFYEKAFICYREDGQSLEKFAESFCDVLMSFANEPNSGYYGDDNKFCYIPDDDTVKKPINAILRDKPTARCCKKLYWAPGMTKAQMIQDNPDILVKFWGSNELGMAMLDRYSEEEWQRLA